MDIKKQLKCLTLKMKKVFFQNIIAKKKFFVESKVKIATSFSILHDKNNLQIDFDFDITSFLAGNFNKSIYLIDENKNFELI